MLNFIEPLVLIVCLFVILREVILSEIHWYLLKRRVKRRHGTLSGLGFTLEYQAFLKENPGDDHEPLFIKKGAKK